MGPLPPFERRPEDENENREKLTWPWEKAPGDKEAKKKLDTKDEKESKKKPEQPKKEKEEKQEPPKKEEKPEKKAEPEEEKRERRATLVEQSIALVAKYEEEPIPRDANTLARLMIAHQVIHLNSQLEQPDNEHPRAPEEIEATLDYITQLDEKFKNPDTKAEPAIEQSYQEIMEVAEATLAEETELETVVKDLNLRQNEDGDIQPVSSRSSTAASKYLQPEVSSVEPTSHLSTEGMSPSRASRAPWAGSQPEGGDGQRSANKTAGQTSDTNPTQEEFSRRKQATKETVPAVATASTLIYLITHLGRKKPKKETKLIIPNNNHGSDYSPSANPHPYTQQNYTPGEQLPSPINQSAYAPPLRSEHTPTIPSRERVAIPDRRPSPALATAAVATAFATTRPNGETARIAAAPEAHHSSSEPTKPEFSALSQRQATTPENSFAESQRKIEHMPLLQLLSMAENVDIGHGQYLRREFESGRIDKEGLVKILKAHSKGRDYQFEFRQQASRFTKLKETSPEFLHPAKPTKTDSLTNNSSDEKRLESDESKPEIKKDIASVSRPLSLAPPTKHDLLPATTSSSVRQPEHIGRRLVLITIATLGGLALIGLLAIAIFNALR